MRAGTVRSEPYRDDDFRNPVLVSFVRHQEVGHDMAGRHQAPYILGVWET